MDNCFNCQETESLVCRIGQNGIQKEYYCGKCETTTSFHNGIEAITYSGELAEMIYRAFGKYTNK